MFKNSLLAILSIFLISCNNDDTSPTINGEKVLIKKISKPDIINGEFRTFMDFTYEDGKLKSISEFHGQINLITRFIYTQDKMTSTYSRLIDNAGPIQPIEIIYNGNLMESAFFPDGDPKAVFAYQNNILTNQTLYLPSEQPPVYASSKDFTIVNGNTISILNNLFNYDDNPLPASKINYTFDNKNNMARDMDPNIKQIFGVYSFDLFGFSKNNILTEKKIDLTENRVEFPEIRYEYTYNSKDFPIEIKKINTTTNALVNHIKIEYYE